VHRGGEILVILEELLAALQVGTSRVGKFPDDLLDLFFAAFHCHLTNIGVEHFYIFFFFLFIADAEGLLLEVGQFVSELTWESIL